MEKTMLTGLSLEKNILRFENLWGFMSGLNKKSMIQTGLISLKEEMQRPKNITKHLRNVEEAKTA
jgi:hypothetical protein